MKKPYEKVVYAKASSHEVGCIPLGAQGNVLLSVEHPVTTKLLVDFFSYGLCIVPLSSITEVEEENV